MKTKAERIKAVESALLAAHRPAGVSPGGTWRQNVMRDIRNLPAAESPWNALAVFDLVALRAAPVLAALLLTFGAYLFLTGSGVEQDLAQLAFFDPAQAVHLVGF